MNTSKDDDFDYEAYVQNNPPDVTKIQWGTEARKQRFEAARLRQTVRIDKDIRERFEQLVPLGQSYEQLVNQALREWLQARDIKELIRAELRQTMQQALASVGAESE